MATLNNIATILNTTIVPNALGDSTTIAEDLSNVSDLGVKFADLTADELKSYMKDFMLGVYYNYMEGKEFKEETFGQYVTQNEFGAIFARLRCRMIPAKESNIVSLVSAYGSDSAPDYTDGHFYGIQTDQNFFPESVAYKLAHSWGVEYYKKCFMDAAGVEKIYAEFEKCAEDSATYMLNELARTNLRSLAVAAYNGSRYVKLLTTYNTMHGYEEGDAGYVDLTNWDLDPDFKLFCQETIIKLKKYVRNLNTKYNDGSIPNFTPERDVRSTLLTDFDTKLIFTASNVFHKELTDIGDHYTIDFWQNQTDELLPVISDSSLFDSIVLDGGDSDDVTIPHVVGIIYDRASAIITERLSKITVKPVPEEDFITLFHHFVKDYKVDTAESGIVLTLE